MSTMEIQYISDAAGNSVGVIVPIALWREIESERETAYQGSRETMKKEQTEARKHTNGSSQKDHPRTMSPAERARTYRAWAESHVRNLPLLSDEDISRESMY